MVARQQAGQSMRSYIKYVEKQSSKPNTRSRYLWNGMSQAIFDYLPHDIRRGEVLLCWYELKDAARDAERLYNLMRRRYDNWFGSMTFYDNPYGFIVDHDGFVVVYTDGACPGNGTVHARGGIGVWFDDDNQWWVETVEIQSSIDIFLIWTRFVVVGMWASHLIGKIPPQPMWLKLKQWGGPW